MADQQSLLCCYAFITLYFQWAGNSISKLQIQQAFSSVICIRIECGISLAHVALSSPDKLRSWTSQSVSYSYFVRPSLRPFGVAFDRQTADSGSRGGRTSPLSSYISPLSLSLLSLSSFPSPVGLTGQTTDRPTIALRCSAHSARLPSH